jgi:hypothetical protein
VQGIEAATAKAVEVSGPEFRTLYRVVKPTLVDGQFTPLQCTSHGSVYTGGSSAVAALDMDFVGGQAWVNGVPTPITSLISCTRASPNGYYTDASGVLVPFAANTLRIGNNGLLVEEQRANICLQSNTLTSGTWTKNSFTNVTTTTTGPDNVAGSATLTNEDSSNSVHYLVQSFVKAASALPYAISVYAAAGPGRTRQVVQVDDGVNGAQVVFNLSNGSVGVAPIGLGGSPFTSISAAVQSQLVNGFYRCILQATTGTSTTLNLKVQNDSGSGSGGISNSYVGTVGNGLYVYGFQIEQAAFPTSYIPTTTTSQTRNADVIPFSTTSWLNTSAGTFYGQMTTLAPASSSNSAIVGFASNGAMGLLAGTDNTDGIYTISGGVLLTATAGSGLWSTGAKGVSAYDAAGITACMNNGTVTTNAVTLTAPDFVSPYVGSRTNSYVNGYIKRLTYWNIKLAPANLKAITT